MSPEAAVRSRKSCSENIQQIYRRSSLTKCDFNNNNEIALWHGCFPVNLLHIIRTPFPTNTSGRLLLCQYVNPFRHHVSGYFNTLKYSVVVCTTPAKITTQSKKEN